MILSPVTHPNENASLFDPSINVSVINVNVTGDLFLPSNLLT
jgi:hypothetical protein